MLDSNLKYLDTVEAAHDASILLIYVRRWMCEFTFLFRPGTPVPLELSAYF